MYKKTIQVGSDLIDINQHVNNIEYVKWMQDVAIEHSASVGCSYKECLEREGGIWVARSHHIEYLASLVEGDCCHLLTWVETIGKLRSTRKYEFRREFDQKLIAKAETVWVFLDAKTNKPKRISEKLKERFQFNE